MNRAALSRQGGTIRRMYVSPIETHDCRLRAPVENQVKQRFS